MRKYVQQYPANVLLFNSIRIGDSQQLLASVMTICYIKSTSSFTFHCLLFRVYVRFVPHKHQTMFDVLHVFACRQRAGWRTSSRSSTFIEISPVATVCSLWHPARAATSSRCSIYFINFHLFPTYHNERILKKHLP